MKTYRTCEQIIDELTRIDALCSEAGLEASSIRFSLDEEPHRIHEYRDMLETVRHYQAKRDALHAELNDPDCKRVFLDGIEITHCPQCNKPIEYEAECEDCGAVRVCRECHKVMLYTSTGYCDVCDERLEMEAAESRKTDYEACRWFEFHA